MTSGSAEATGREAGGGAGGRSLTIGLWADPDTPAEIAKDLSDELPGLLSRRVTDEVTWEVEVLIEPFALEDRDEERLLETARERREREGWDIVVCLTDLPLHGERSRLPLAADVSTELGAALVSLPALGGMRLRRRVREAIVRVVDTIAAEWGIVSQPRHGRTLLGERMAPVRRIPSSGRIDARYVATGLRGRLRVLVGMVRANEPWRIVPGLKSALAAALATGAIALVNSNVWLLSDALGITRLLLAMLAAVLIMVAWLVIVHDLWESRSGPYPRDTERVVLYNASTVLSLALGVLMLYAALYVLTLGSAVFIIEDGVFGRQLGHPARAGDFLELAWLTTSVAVVAGAVGSSLESTEAVRAAAYSRREQERRAKAAAATDSDT